MATVKKNAIKIFSVDRDYVVNALVATGKTDYKVALESLVPLINRLDIQRKVQNPKFYERLKRDLLKGCLMPPITLAFVRRSHTGLANAKAFQEFVTTDINKAFVLDGIQRLSTIARAYDEDPSRFPKNQPLFLNILICRSMDNLLYRMITLNNGQKPMTTRHQIEILSANQFTVTNGEISLAKEKDNIRRQQGVFSQSDFVLAYMAFLSNSTTVDSQKLIQEKLDELVASKILEHDPTEDSIEFSEVTDFIAKCCTLSELDTWFKVPNNLIGFCASARQGFDTIKEMRPEQFLNLVEIFEEALRSFDVSKLKLGRTRRQAVAYCIRNIDQLLDADVDDITERLVELIEA